MRWWDKFTKSTRKAREDFTRRTREKYRTGKLHFLNGEGINLMNRNLTRKNLKGKKLMKANLSHSYLCGANLQRAHLEGADLEGADLSPFGLTNGTKVRTNLKGAHLEGAKLQGANLEGANLEGANLEGARLEGANLENADLTDADLSKIHISGKTNFNNAIGFENNKSLSRIIVDKINDNEEISEEEIIPTYYTSSQTPYNEEIFEEKNTPYNKAIPENINVIPAHDYDNDVGDDVEPKGPYDDMEYKLGNEIMLNNNVPDEVKRRDYPLGGLRKKKNKLSAKRKRTNRKKKSRK